MKAFCFCPSQTNQEKVPPGHFFNNFLKHISKKMQTKDDAKEVEE